MEVIRPPDIFHDQGYKIVTVVDSATGSTYLRHPRSSVSNDMHTRDSRGVNRQVMQTRSTFGTLDLYIIKSFFKM